MIDMDTKRTILQEAAKAQDNGARLSSISKFLVLYVNIVVAFLCNIY